MPIPVSEREHLSVSVQGQSPPPSLPSVAQRVERVEQHCLEEEVHGKRVRGRPGRHG